MCLKNTFFVFQNCIHESFWAFNNSMFNGCLLCCKCHLSSADEETTSASLILCLKQAVLKQHKKKPTLFQQKESWDHLHAQKLIWHRISNRKKLVAFIKIEVIMICGFSLGSMLQFLLLSEMLCIPAQGDSFTKTYNILEEDYMEIR